MVFRIRGTTSVEIDFEPNVELLPPTIETKTGDTNKGLKIISTEWKERVLRVVLEGLAGETYELGIVNEDRLSSVSGATRKENKFLIKMPDGPAGEFVRHTMQLSTR